MHKDEFPLGYHEAVQKSTRCNDSIGKAEENRALDCMEIAYGDANKETRMSGQISLLGILEPLDCRWSMGSLTMY